jgi:hypothetical protein
VAESKDKVSIKEGYKIAHEHTTKVSEMNRTLALAGFAIIWLYKVGSDANQTIPGDLVPAAFILALGIALDMLQSLVNAGVWYFETRDNEKKHQLEFKVTSSYLMPGNVLFVAKLAATFAGYVSILVYLAGKMKVG